MHIQCATPLHLLKVVLHNIYLLKILYLGLIHEIYFYVKGKYSTSYAFNIFTIIYFVQPHLKREVYHVSATCILSLVACIGPPVESDREAIVVDFYMVLSVGPIHGSIFM